MDRRVTSIDASRSLKDGYYFHLSCGHTQQVPTRTIAAHLVNGSMRLPETVFCQTCDKARFLPNYLSEIFHYGANYAQHISNDDGEAE